MASLDPQLPLIPEEGLIFPKAIKDKSRAGANVLPRHTVCTLISDYPKGGTSASLIMYLISPTAQDWNFSDSAVLPC